MATLARYKQRKEQITIQNWKCLNCTFLNRLDTAQCEMCSTYHNVWQCGYCFTVNLHLNKICGYCHCGNKYWKSSKYPYDEPSSSDGLEEKEPVPPPDGLEEKEPSPIDAFLSELGFSQYSAAFREEGFETMDELQEINDNQLKEIIRVTKLAHRIKILKAIRTFFTDTSYSACPETHENEGTIAPKPSTVYFMGTFLENIGMERYFDAFKVNGLLDETSLKCVNKQTLILLGIDNESSHEAIMKGIKSHLSLHSPTLYI
eukprot:1125703_1